MSVEPIPCGYCSGPISATLPKWTVYCGDDCLRAAAALRKLRAQRTQGTVQQPRKKKARKTSHPCTACGVGRTRGLLCSGCAAAKRDEESEWDLSGGRWVQQGARKVWVAA